MKNYLFSLGFVLVKKQARIRSIFDKYLLLSRAQKLKKSDLTLIKSIYATLQI